MIITVLLLNYFENKCVYTYTSTHTPVTYADRKRMIKQERKKEKWSFWKKSVIKFPVFFLKNFSKCEIM